MKGVVLLRDVDGGEAADTLVKAIEGGDEVAVGVVGDVELEAETHSMGFEGSLPEAFDRKASVVGFVWRIFAAEGYGERGVALRPLAFDGPAVRRKCAFEVCTDGGDIEFESAATEGSGAGFDGVDGLVEAVERGVEFALGILGEVENEMELRFAGLKSAGVDAVEIRGGSGDLGGRRKGSRQQKHRYRCDVKASWHAYS